MGTAQSTSCQAKLNTMSHMERSATALVILTVMIVIGVSNFNSISGQNVSSIPLTHSSVFNYYLVKQFILRYVRCLSPSPAPFLGAETGNPSMQVNMLRPVGSPLVLTLLSAEFLLNPERTPAMDSQ